MFRPCFDDAYHCGWYDRDVIRPVVVSYAMWPTWTLSRQIHSLKPFTSLSSSSSSLKSQSIHRLPISSTHRLTMVLSQRFRWTWLVVIMTTLSCWLQNQTRLAMAAPEASTSSSPFTRLTHHLGTAHQQHAEVTNKIIADVSQLASTHISSSASLSMADIIIIVVIVVVVLFCCGGFGYRRYSRV